MAFIELKSSLVDSVNCTEWFHVLDFRTVSKFLLYDVIMKKVHTYELSHQILQENIAAISEVNWVFIHIVTSKKRFETGHNLPRPNFE